uniref:(northern house mosquito) hypothetical protein n=1 Tax=Culex pipiens TaxID=7175 RepID=A0A8D8IFW9_CULPI
MDFAQISTIGLFSMQNRPPNVQNDPWNILQNGSRYRGSVRLPSKTVSLTVDYTSSSLLNHFLCCLFVRLALLALESVENLILGKKVIGHSAKQTEFFNPSLF